MKSESINSIQSISLDEINEPSKAVRTVISAEGLEDLAKSIAQVGVIQPIVLQKKGSRYEIVAGHRRFLASRMCGKVSVPAIITELKDRDTDLVKLHENYCREDINCVDEAKYFLMLKEKYEWNIHEIATYISKSDSYVVTRLALLGADARVLAALETRQITMSQAREILSAENEKVRYELLRVTIENGATVNSIRMMRQSYESVMGPSVTDSNPSAAGASSYESEKHLIRCPACDGVYPVNSIYPLSVCKTCYDGLLAGLRGK